MMTAIKKHIMQSILLIEIITSASCISGELSRDEDYFRDANKFLYVDLQKDIWVADIYGKVKYNTKIKWVAYSGRLYCGSTYPVLSPNGFHMAYVDKDRNMNIYNIRTNSSRTVFHTITNSNQICSLNLFSCWLVDSKAFIFHVGPMDEYYGAGCTSDNLKDFKYGFYSYTLATNKVKFIAGLEGIVAAIPKTDVVIGNRKTNNTELYLFDFSDESTQRFLRINEKYNQIHAFDSDNITYTFHPGYSAQVIYQNISKNIKVVIDEGQYAEMQFPEFISDGKIIYGRYYFKGRLEIKELVICDIRLNKKKVLSYSKVRYKTIGDSLIILKEKNLFTYNIANEEINKIADDVFLIPGGH